MQRNQNIKKIRLMLLYLKSFFKPAGFLLILLFNYFCVAQKPVSELTTPQGKWEFRLYRNSIKSTFTPNNYKTNEQVSNAVIYKPSKDSKMDQPVNVLSREDGSFIFYNKLILLKYFDSSSHKGFKFLLRQGEKIFGTGERSLPMDRRGYKIILYNQPNYGYGINAENLNYSVPFIISSEGYGIFFDNPSKSYLDIGKTNGDILEYGALSGELSFYIIPGKNVSEILAGYHELTGTQPIPARWVFGNLMSRFGYRNEKQLTSIVSKMLAEKFPVDAVILDLFWFGDSIKGTMGNLDWVNKKAWPDPAAMISNLNKQGIKTIIITEPFVLNTTPNYEPSKKYHAVDSSGNPFLITDFYFGNGGLIDIFRKDAQDWFWSKYKMQISKGIAGWWGDLGEPERHPLTMMHNLKDLGFNRLFKADEVHNIYGHYWDKMLFDKYAKEYPDKRLFNLNRSGYAGSARYGVFPWSGDVGRNWSGLQAQLPVMLGMSISGVPYIHADAGGFALGEGDPELYTRWIQFATFTPVLRPHGTALGDLAPEVKDIPSEGALYDEPYKNIVRRYTRLRYQLLPYNYTLAYEQAKYGKALVQPMFYNASLDSNLFKAGEQFMWGDHMLIAPVIEKNTSTKNMYLPEGKWYNFFTDVKLAGKQWIRDSVTLNNIPVYVKEGAFIPMFLHATTVKNTGDYTGKELTIKYYPSSSKSTYTFFDDDGHTNNTLSKGNYELINFEGTAKDKEITIHVRPGNKKILMKRKLVFTIAGNPAIAIVKWNGMVINLPRPVEVKYNGKPIRLDIILK